jgi:hypothetical protein
MNKRIEYSPRLGKFKISDAMDQIDTSSGFYMISMMEEQRAEKFIAYVEGKYPQLMIQNRFPFPPLETIKKELLAFLNENISDLEKDIDQPYRRNPPKS